MTLQLARLENAAEAQKSYSESMIRDMAPTKAESIIKNMEDKLRQVLLYPELSFDDDAPFVISAPRDIWELIFLGKLDPFVAVNQRKMQLKGDLLRLSCWYTPFSRLFELFKQVRIK
jgi:putative sterol carrier protein